MKQPETALNLIPPHSDDGLEHTASPADGLGLFVAHQKCSAGRLVLSAKMQINGLAPLFRESALGKKKNPHSSL